VLIALVTAVALAADPTTAGRLAAADPAGTVWLSVDGGADWRPVWRCPEPVGRCGALAWRGGLLWVGCGDQLVALDGARPVRRVALPAPIAELTAGPSLVGTGPSGDRLAIDPSTGATRPAGTGRAPLCTAVALPGGRAGAPTRRPRPPPLAALIPRLTVAANWRWQRGRTRAPTARLGRRETFELFFQLSWQLDEISSHGASR
jgi:hypothetical protein